jgi:predicted NUDIX family NTP pyrophosphohydrolase
MCTNPAHCGYAGVMKTSAGLLMYRVGPAGRLEVLLAHPGGPFWRNKDQGAWTLPKGEYEAPEEALAAARREFTEETGFDAPGPFLPLGEVKQRSGKRVAAWAFNGDCDPQALRCNTFEMEWPPRSGQRQSFPEIDRAQWFTLGEARTMILPAQRELLDRLESALHGPHPPHG